MKLSGLNIFRQYTKKLEVKSRNRSRCCPQSKALYSFVFSDATEDDGSQVGHPGHHVTTQRLRGHVSAGNAKYSLFLIPGFTSARHCHSEPMLIIFAPAHAQYLPHQLWLLY